MTLLTRQTFLVRFRASASIRCQSDPHACILFTFCQSRSSTSLHELRMALLSHTVRAYSHRVRDASALALMLKRYLEALHWAIASRQDTVVPRLVVRVIVAAPNERGTARNNATNLESSHRTSRQTSALNLGVIPLPPVTQCRPAGEFPGKCMGLQRSSAIKLRLY